MKNLCACIAVLWTAAVGTGCMSTGTTAPDAPAQAPPGAAMVAAVREAGTGADDELDVRPLRDAGIEDLRQQAEAFEARSQYTAAAEALDRAIALHEADPALLQERAELALRLADLDGALRHARRAIELGAGVGPLCRRHWATIEQVAQWRAVHADAATAAQARGELPTARAKREACTVAAPPRY